MHTKTTKKQPILLVHFNIINLEKRLKNLTDKSKTKVKFHCLYSIEMGSDIFGSSVKFSDTFVEFCSGFIKGFIGVSLVIILSLLIYIGYVKLCGPTKEEEDRLKQIKYIAMSKLKKKNRVVRPAEQFMNSDDNEDTWINL